MGAAGAPERRLGPRARGRAAVLGGPRRDVRRAAPRAQEHVDEGDRVATRLRYVGRGRGSGIDIDGELYHQVITFRDGVIVRIEYFTTWDEALAAVRDA